MYICDCGSIVLTRFVKPLTISLKRKGTKHATECRPLLSGYTGNLTQRQILRLFEFDRNILARDFVPPYHPGMMKLKAMS